MKLVIIEKFTKELQTTHVIDKESSSYDNPVLLSGNLDGDSVIQWHSSLYNDREDFLNRDLYSVQKLLYFISLQKVGTAVLEEGDLNVKLLERWGVKPSKVTLEEVNRKEFDDIEDISISFNIPLLKQVKNDEDKYPIVIQLLSAGVDQLIGRKLIPYIYGELDASLFECVFLPKDTVAIVDEEGLLKSGNIVGELTVQNNSISLAGNIIMLKEVDGHFFPFFDVAEDEEALTLARNFMKSYNFRGIVR